MQTATSDTEIKSRYLSICVHHYTLRAPCPKGQGIADLVLELMHMSCSSDELDRMAYVRLEDRHLLRAGRSAGILGHCALHLVAGSTTSSFFTRIARTIPHNDLCGAVFLSKTR